MLFGRTLKIVIVKGRQKERESVRGGGETVLHSKETSNYFALL